jgi:hypothetical protein
LDNRRPQSDYHCYQFTTADINDPKFAFREKSGKIGSSLVAIPQVPCFQGLAEGRVNFGADSPDPIQIHSFYFAKNNGQNSANTTNATSHLRPSRTSIMHSASDRHTSGASARKIQKWLGHCSLETTLRYLAFGDDTSDEVRNIVNASTLVYESL